MVAGVNQALPRIVCPYPDPDPASLSRAPSLTLLLSSGVVRNLSPSRLPSLSKLSSTRARHDERHDEPLSLSPPMCAVLFVVLCCMFSVTVGDVLAEHAVLYSLLRNVLYR